MADAMVIASAGSQRQMAAIAAHLVEKLKVKGIRPVPLEGMEHGVWVLVDAGDVIVHLFRPDSRRHYNLEKMWGADLPEPEPAALAV